MAYSDGGLREVAISKSGDISALADVGMWSPGYQPVTVRAVSVVLLAAVACAGQVTIDKRPTPGSDTSRAATTAVVNVPNAATAGTVYFKDQLNFTVLPGEELVAEVTDAFGGSAKADIILLIEPGSENPANNSEMIETS